MILLYGKNPVGNVIHAVVGPESTLWTDLHGALTVDITPLLEACDTNMPVLLNLTKCDSEAQLNRRLNETMASGAPYPFLPGTSVFSPLGMQAAAQDGPVIDGAKRAKEQPVAKASAAQAAQQDTEGLRSVKIPRGRCDRCSDKKAELIPGLTPPICFNCAKIDLYQARKDKPAAGAPPKLPEEFS